MVSKSIAQQSLYLEAGLKVSREYAAYERRIRELARKKGYALRTSRSQMEKKNFGLYQLLNKSTNRPELGTNYDADLSAVEEFLVALD